MDKYDIVIDIDNILDVNNGWNVYYSPELLSRAENPGPNLDKLENYTSKVIVSVLGLFNKGKTWLLNKVCTGEKLASGRHVTTKGLSFKEPTGDAIRDIILLDTAGTSSPLKGS